MHFTFLSSVDPALGRLDYESLSDQALMEMLIHGIDEDYIDEFQDENGNFIDVCEWYSITCTEDRVTRICLNGCDIYTTPFRFDFIPPLVTSFEAYECNLSGTLNTSILPLHLQTFDCGLNDLDGTIRFKDFPGSLEDITIGPNGFHGSCALSDLPRSLIHFFAYDNDFSGEIDLCFLPPTIAYLELQDNKLSGPICIRHLPNSIVEIRLSRNAFTGDFRMLSFPASLQKVNISKNALSGKAVLAKATGEMHFWLKNDSITSVVDEYGNVHEWESQILQQ